MAQADPPVASYTFCHDCLFNLDLLDEIMQHLGQVQDPPDPDVIPSRSLRRSLLSFGLTCRALSEPALKVLWHRLDNLIPLLKLLPRFMVIPGQHWSVKGMLAPRDWILFDKYAVWVKEVVLDTNVLLDDHTIMLLANHRCPILPNLILFKCPHWLYVVWQVIFLGTPLIETDDPAACRGIKPVAPLRLTHLSLTHFSSYFNTFPAGFESLQSLKIVDPQPFRGTHQPSEARLMPSLLSLTISLTAVEVAIPTFILPNLRHLRWASGLPQALEFLQTLESPDMESISLLPIGHRPWPDGAAKGLADLVAARWPRTLRAFDLAADRFHDVDALTTCTALERFTLRASIPSRTFDIDEFVEIGRNWASLSSLSLPEPIARIELATLSRFAELWPALAFLEVNLIDLDTIPSLSTTPVLSHGLKDIIFHCSPPHHDGDARLLARHLDRLFPRLDSIRYGVPPKVYATHLAWSTVLEEVFRCQDSRRRWG
ncbi:hypothetical protein B0H16DRAFT_1506472 [Mycena metata]|uniref:Uncharacterized protein n=1 Tax=Mycena metata TaxID=1033252 RepID=A0AAD7NUC3_9AGAR|nr:hypothetical protein B0H16DRAFT_1506472 [Mycena metata]